MPVLPPDRTEVPGMRLTTCYPRAVPHAYRPGFQVQRLDDRGAPLSGINGICLGCTEKGTGTLLLDQQQARHPDGPGCNHIMVDPKEPDRTVGTAGKVKRLKPVTAPASPVRKNFPDGTVSDGRTRLSFRAAMWCGKECRPRSRLFPGPGRCRT